MTARARITLPYMAYESPNGVVSRFPPLKARLSWEEHESAMILFRRGLDNLAIARELECTPAAAANALARFRDRERCQ